MDEIVKFYMELYSKDGIKDDDVNDYLSNLPEHKVLNQVEKEFCDREITVNEIKNAISSLKNNRSPGSDGALSFISCSVMNLLIFIMPC